MAECGRTNSGSLILGQSGACESTNDLEQVLYYKVTPEMINPIVYFKS